MTMWVAIVIFLNGDIKFLYTAEPMYRNDCRKLLIEHMKEDLPQIRNMDCVPRKDVQV